MDNAKVQKMRESLEQFRMEYESKYFDKSVPATVADIEELARQTFYVLNNFISTLEEE